MNTKFTFTVQQSALNKALNICSKALGDNKIIPIYESFLFDIEGNKLTISACDGKIIISTGCEIKSEISLKICIPGRDLQEYISKSANEVLSFEIDGSIFTIKTSSGKCEIPCEPGDDFPKINFDGETKSFQIASDDFLELLFKTMFAIDDNDLAPSFCGLNVVIGNGKITCTSSNRHKFSTWTTPIDFADDLAFIIPKEALQKIQSLSPAGMLDISANNKTIGISWGEINIVARLTDEKLIDYLPVMPVNNDTHFLTSRSALMASVDRIKSFSILSKAVKFEIVKDGLIITADNPDYSKSATETISGALASGNEVVFGLNWEYLLQTLKAIADDTVWFSLEHGMRPILLTSERRQDVTSKENLFLLMPCVI